MARKVNIILEDDLDGTPIEGDKGGTLGFALDGMAYEIDLTEKNQAALRKALEKYVAASRKVGKTKLGRTPGGSVTSIGAARSANAGARMGREQANAIRDWAKSTGQFVVAERGRIPGAVVEAYQAAHG